MCSRTASGCSAAGTSARTHGHGPTSGPLADGWTVPSAFSTRGPTRAHLPAAASAATISGTVTAKDGGAAVPDLAVELRNAQKGLVATVCTGGNGQYAFPDRAAGTYYVLFSGAVTVNGEPEERRGRQLHRGDVVAVEGMEDVRIG